MTREAAINRAKRHAKQFQDTFYVIDNGDDCDPFRYYVVVEAKLHYCDRADEVIYIAS